MTYERLLEEVSALALTDRAFRNELLNDASAAIADVVGYNLPADLVVHVHVNRFDSQTKELHVVVPVDPEEMAQNERSLVPLYMRFRGSDHLCIADTGPVEVTQVDAVRQAAIEADLKSQRRR